MNFKRRRRGLARLVAALGSENVALESLSGEEFRQIGQVLGGRCVVGPVILVDEQDAQGMKKRGSGSRMERADVERRSGVGRDRSSSLSNRGSYRSVVARLWLCPGGCLGAATGVHSPFSSARTSLHPGPRAHPCRINPSVESKRAAGDPHIRCLRERRASCKCSSHFPRSPGRATLLPRWPGLSTAVFAVNGGGELMTRDDSGRGLNYAGRAFS